jgi:hypothetical protein
VRIKNLIESITYNVNRLDSTIKKLKDDLNDTKDKLKEAKINVDSLNDQITLLSKELERLEKINVLSSAIIVLKEIYSQVDTPWYKEHGILLANKMRNAITKFANNNGIISNNPGCKIIYPNPEYDKIYALLEADNKIFSDSREQENKQKAIKFIEFASEDRTQESITKALKAIKSIADMNLQEELLIKLRKIEEKENPIYKKQYFTGLAKKIVKDKNKRR